MQKYRLGKSQQSENCSDSKQEGNLDVLVIQDHRWSFCFHGYFITVCLLTQITKRFRVVMSISAMTSMMELRVRLMSNS